MFFVDDGISGTSFERGGFQQMQKMVEEGKICRVIVKDLSRFGREMVEVGRLTQIVYPSLGVTFISLHENKNKLVFGIGILPRLWRKTAFLCCKEPETQSGILEMF